MVWSHEIRDALTGRLQLPVFPVDWSWRTGKVPGSGSHTFWTRTSGISDEVWGDLVQPWSRCIVVSWDGQPVYAGLITDPELDETTGELTVPHIEFANLLKGRLVYGQAAFARDGVFNVSGKSARSAISAVVQWATQGAPGYNYPVVGFLGHEPGPIAKSWPYYELASADKMLAELTNSDGAPDVYFRPRLSSLGLLEWALEIGTPTLPGPTVEWVVGAPKSPAIGTKTKLIGSGVKTGIIAVGAGHEHDTILGFAGGLNTFPVRLDAVRMHKTVADAAELDALAMGSLRPIQKPIVQVSVTSALAEIALPNVRVGTGINLLRSNGVFAGGGVHHLEVIALSGGPGMKVGLETQ
ncbi:hypothetical protein [Microbacterium sp. Ag1]|uniref:hypothetical protein n=1 Tax=Microbacterium sp. Ag1 TaxID=1643443 RepID=UPI00062973DD|nr:hypothetical protein [Microbacterium sp. Ag1]KKX97743.1 hypothetical protein AAY78_11170 [Microbacterium sp. Ag1]